MAVSVHMYRTDAHTCLSPTVEQSSSSWLPPPLQTVFRGMHYAACPGRTRAHDTQIRGASACDNPCSPTVPASQPGRQGYVPPLARPSVPQQPHGLRLRCSHPGRLGRTPPKGQAQRALTAPCAVSVKPKRARYTVRHPSPAVPQMPMYRQRGAQPPLQPRQHCCHIDHTSPMRHGPAVARRPFSAQRTPAGCHGPPPCPRHVPYRADQCTASSSPAVLQTPASTRVHPSPPTTSQSALSCLRHAFACSQL